TLIAVAIPLLLQRSAVICQAIGLDDKAQVGPVEVYAAPVQPNLSLGSGQTPATNEPKKTPLELGVGERECRCVEQGPEPSYSRSPRSVVEHWAQGLGVDELEAVGLANRTLQQRIGQVACQVDQRVDGVGDRYFPYPAPSVQVHALAAVNAN